MTVVLVEVVEEDAHRPGVLRALVAVVTGGASKPAGPMAMLADLAPTAQGALAEVAFGGALEGGVHGGAPLAGHLVIRPHRLGALKDRDEEVLEGVVEAVRAAVHEELEMLWDLVAAAHLKDAYGSHLAVHADHGGLRSLGQAGGHGTPELLGVRIEDVVVEEADGVRVVAVGLVLQELLLRRLAVEANLGEVPLLQHGGVCGKAALLLEVLVEDALIPEGQAAAMAPVVAYAWRCCLEPPSADAT